MVDEKTDRRVITLLPGDGVGPEVTAVARQVLEETASRFSMEIVLQDAHIGLAALERYDDPLPAETLEMVGRSDAVLLGAIGGEQTGRKNYAKRPEAGLLGIRKYMNLYANLRPVKVHPSLVSYSSLKQEYVDGTDLVVVRELLGGTYFGEPRGRHTNELGQEFAVNTMVYSEPEIDRIARMAFELARGRRRSVVSVDKANVLEVCLLWREVVSRVHREDYPDVELSHQYVDNCAMQLVRNPRQFDVILTENLFGDIISDEAAMLAGSIGMLPSASLGEGGALYEPVHGSAPDIAGQDLVNPMAAVLSVAMMFRHSFGLADASDLIERAVYGTVEQGYGTRDLAGADTKVVGTREMGDRILETLASL